MGHPRPRINLFLFFFKQISIHFSANLCEKMSIQYTYGAGIRTHDFQFASMIP